jgi:hypothetical protein
MHLEQDNLPACAKQNILIWIGAFAHLDTGPGEGPISASADAA